MTLPGPTLKDEVLGAIVDMGSGVTADEVAELLGRSVLAVRPRVSELYDIGLIRDSGERRRNASGINAKVWISA